MRTCLKCDNLCYDHELYCGNCGTTLEPLQMRCRYCGTSFEETAPSAGLRGTNCPNCGGLVEFDVYPRKLGIRPCSVCHSMKPIKAVHCPFCGSKDKTAAMSATPKARMLRGLKKLFLICGIGVVALFLLGVCLVIADEIAYRNSSDYIDYDEMFDKAESSVAAVRDGDKTVTYTEIKVDDLDKCINDISTGDWVEVTGMIDERSTNSGTLVPETITLDNKDYCVRLYFVGWDDPVGNEFNDYHVKGELITVRGYVTYVYDSICTMELKVVELVD